MVISCENNCGAKASMKRPKNGSALCQECFFTAFESEVAETIEKGALFNRGDFVAIGASGGKDSTVLAYVLKLLNQRHDYGLRLVLLSVDEGITGYRDDSLETVKRNEIEYQLPLKILSYKELYGWTMDEIVREVGRKNNCTFCGVFRRQALDRGAVLLGVNKIVTGHNADDVAETIFMNLLRGDVARLQRCTAITTGADGSLPRCKPFKYTYEKEIVMYAYFKKLDYFSTECIYSPNAYRGHVRTLIKDLERIRPSSIIDIIHSGESLSIREGVKMPTQGVCQRCNYISSMSICKACVMLEGLNKGLPKLGIGKSSKVKGTMESLEQESGADAINSGCGNRRGKQGCCGAKGCGDNNGNELNTNYDRILKVGGKRSAIKQKKARDRNTKMNILTNDGSETIPHPPLTEEINSLNNNENCDLHLVDEGLDDFFGCGGFSRNEISLEQDDEYDEVGTIRSKIELQHRSVPGEEMDIENLGQLASTMLHLGGRDRGSGHL